MFSVAGRYDLVAIVRVSRNEELADVICYVLAIANEMEIDIASTFLRKMDLNRRKYPVAEFRGRFGVDDPNPVSS